MAGCHRRSPLLFFFFFVALILFSLYQISVAASPEKFVGGTVLELDESNFDSTISTFDFILVDFYAPWCGHCKRLAPELDVAAPLLAELKEPVVIAKLNADKFKKLASKYEIDGYPTLKLFAHGIPIDYSGPRKAELLVRFLKKFVAPDVAILEQDEGVHKFVETAGVEFPIFIGFGLNESMILEFGKKYKKRAWFSVAKDFSEELMVKYDFDKVPALVSFHPKYNEHGVFYGPFEGGFLEGFIQQNQLPLAVPINYETLKLLNGDQRKIALTFVDDKVNKDSSQLIKFLRAAASANRDLVFGYVGVKELEEFVQTFRISVTTKLPKVIIWDGREEYYDVQESDSIEDDEHQGSQIIKFLQAYRDGKLVQRKINGPSLMGFLSQLPTGALYMIIVLVVLLLILLYIVGSDDGRPRSRDDVSGSSSADGEKEEYRPDHKED